MTEAKNNQGGEEILDIDFENCKGKCGYTPWCKSCEKTVLLKQVDDLKPESE